MKHSNNMNTTIENKLQKHNRFQTNEQELQLFRKLYTNLTIPLAVTDTNFTIITSNNQFNDFLKKINRDKHSNSIKDLLPTQFNTFFNKLKNIINQEIETTMHDSAIITLPDSVIHKIDITVHTIIFNKKIKQLAFEIITNSVSKANFDIYKKSMLALANASHDIKTPMNSIIGYTDLIENQIQNNNCSEYVSHIKNNAQLILSLTNDILDHANIENGSLSINAVPFSLHDLIDTIYSDTEVQISQKRKNITLSKNIDNDLQGKITCDPMRLQQILTNLLSNAVKFTNEGAIEIGAMIQENSNITFYVKDNGPGISQKKQLSIFDKYTSFDVNNQGSGLGLYICKQIINQMNGTINIKSQTGSQHGTTISFTLPYKPYIEKQYSLKKKKNDRSNHILLVEDNPTNQTLMKAYFNKLKYPHTIAETGQECFDYVKNNYPYGLILMDIQLPDINGIETMQMIRNYEDKNNYTPVPIIALTASIPQNDTDICHSTGFDGFIEKPVNLNVLTQIINKHITITH